MIRAVFPARSRRRRAETIAISIAAGLALAAVVGWVGGVPGLRFDFLLQRAGFQISEAVIEVAAADPVWLTLLAGLINTVRVSLVAIAVAVPLGIALALLRGASHRPVTWLAAVIIEPVRNTPVLLQLFLWYGIVTQLLPGPRHAFEPLPGVLLCNRGLFLPWVTGAGVEWPTLAGFNIDGGIAVSPELTVLGFGLALFHGCYLAEIFRAGFRAVSHGQRDAARALSLPPLVTLRKVVLPQALSFALPPIAAQILALVKNSSLAVAIGFPDLIAVLNTTVNQNGRALEGLALTIAVFLGLNSLLGAAIGATNRWFSPGTEADLVVERCAVADGVPPKRPMRGEVWGAVALGALLALPALAILRWGVLDAVWFGTPSDCAVGHGACWAVVTEKARLILFGPYPSAELWRPAFAGVTVVAFAAAIGIDRLRHIQLSLIGLVLTVLAWLVLLGGGAGLSRVPTVAWGGLTLTVGLALATLAAACLIAVPLAVCRLAERPAVAVPAFLFIEIFRSVPLVALLLSADLLIPRLLPVGWQIDKLWRASAAITLLSSVNLAEVLRGAIGAVSVGQREAARVLGLSAAQAFVLVVLPQAVRIAAPAAVNVFVGTIKDTSLVLIVGILDVTGAAKAAVADPVWRAYAPDMYALLALVYFALCYPLARFANAIENQATAASPSKKRSMSAASL